MGNYGNAEHKRRTERIQETGGKLRGGTNGNVWEWGPKSAREDYLMEMDYDKFEDFMEHCEDVARYETEIATLKSDLAKAGVPL